LIAVDTPVKLTVDVPAINVDPAPDVSQLPLTLHAPVVRVSVPDVPPVMVTLDTVTEEAFAFRRPASPTLNAPPTRPRSLVARVVVPPPPWTVSVPDQTRAFVAMVNVPVDAPLLNVTL
jgi:hypothetical protein